MLPGNKGVKMPKPKPPKKTPATKRPPAPPPPKKKPAPRRSGWDSKSKWESDDLGSTYA